MKKTKTSSAKSFKLHFKPCAKSLIQIKNRSGSRIETCGTPALMPSQSEH